MGRNSEHFGDPRIWGRRFCFWAALSSEAWTIAAAHGRAYLERCVEVRANEPAELQAEAAFALALMLWPDPSQRGRAIKLAQQAHTAAAASDRDGAGKLRNTIGEWIGSNAPSL